MWPKKIPKKNLEFYFIFKKRKGIYIFILFYFLLSFFSFGKNFKEKKLADYHTFIIMTFYFILLNMNFS